MTKLKIHLHDGSVVNVDENGAGVLSVILREKAIKIDGEEIPFHSIVYVECEETDDKETEYEDDFCVPQSESDGRCAEVGKAIVGTDVVCEGE